MKQLIQHQQLIKQQGVTALLTTLMIALIATTATIYANRNSLMAQQGANNDYQYTMALQAAETGNAEFIKMIEADLVKLTANPDDGTTVLLQKKGTTTPPTSCAPGTTSFPFEFKSTYAGGAGGATFAVNKYYAETSDLLTAPTGTNNVDPGLAWRVRGKIEGDNLFIISEGCTGNTQTGHDICTGSNNLSLVRNLAKLQGGLGISSSAVTIGNYADSNLSAHITPEYLSDPKPKCAVTVGESYNQRGAAAFTCQAGGACTPTLDAGLKTGLFERFFSGHSKTEVREIATTAGTKYTGCPGGSITASDNQIIWIDGNIGTCSITGSTKAIVVVDGDVSGSLTAEGFVYINNLYQAGEVEIKGSLAIEQAWDKGPLTDTYVKDWWHYPNHKNDAEAGKTFNDYLPNPPHVPLAPAALFATHSAQGAIKVNYKEKTFNPPFPPKVTNSSGTWIDF